MQVGSGFMREYAQGIAIARVLLEGELPVSSTSPSMTANYLESSMRSSSHGGGSRATGELQDSSRALFTNEPSRARYEMKRERRTKDKVGRPKLLTKKERELRKQRRREKRAGRTQ